MSRKPSKAGPIGRRVRRAPDCGVRRTRWRLRIVGRRTASPSLSGSHVTDEHTRASAGAGRRGGGPRRNRARLARHPVPERRCRPHRVRLQRLHTVRIRAPRGRASERGARAISRGTFGRRTGPETWRPPLLLNHGPWGIARGNRHRRDRIRARAEFDRRGAGRASRLALLGRPVHRSQTCPRRVELARIRRRGTRPF